jgi:hypothetical protein
LKFRVLPPAVIASVLMGVLLLVSPCSGIGVTIPPPPYIPKSPAEDIVMVQAYIEQGIPNILHLTVTLAAATPPTGQELWIIVTRLQGSPATEVVIYLYTYNSAPKSTHSFTVPLVDGGNVDIALYAMVGVMATDRWPNTGFQRIGARANQFTDYDSVGGVVLPTNTFVILAPYLAVIGLVATTAVAVRKRRQ